MAKYKTYLTKEWSSELRRTAAEGAGKKAEHYILLALKAFEAQDYSRAASLAEQAKKLAPRSGLVRELSGLTLYRAGKFKEALRELMAFRRITGSVSQNHVIADCYRATGQNQKAVEITGEVERGKVDDDGWVELMIVAASALADAGDYEKALSQIARADEKPKRAKPRHLRLWYAKANILEAAGRSGESKDLFKRVAQVDPDYFDVAERIRK